MSTIVTGLEGATIAAALAYGVSLAIRAYFTLQRIDSDSERLVPTRPTPSSTGGEGDSGAPHVTVIQPILGGDPALAEVLSETLQHTPRWALFRWMVDEDDTLGRETATRLAATDARVTVHLCPPPAPDENPKTKKLALALHAVRTPYLAVLDDDTMIGESNLVAALIALGAPHWRPSAAAPTSVADLYTGLPSYDVLPGVANGLLAHFVNDNAGFTYLALQRWFGALTINGMFYVARTAALREIDAFERIRGELCDDYALAHLVRGHGWRIHQGATALRLRTSLAGFDHYRAQMHRWFVFARVLLRDQPLVRRLALSTLLGAPPVLLVVVVLGMFTGRVGAEVGVAVLFGRHLTLGAVQQRVLRTRPGPLPSRSLALSLASELMLPLHWLHAALVPTIRWRSRSIHVERDGRYRQVDDSSEART
jgi:ceramide glucosyltransferase